MLPLPMNEYVQENLNAVGFDTQFEVMEWNALVTFSFQPVTGDASTKAGTNGINISRATVDPYSAFMRLYHSEFVPPKGANWGILKDAKLDELINKAHTTLRPRRADQGTGRRPYLHRRPGLLGLHRARSQPARHEPEGDGLRAGPELVPGPHAHRDEVAAKGGRRCCSMRCGA